MLLIAEKDGKTNKTFAVFCSPQHRLLFWPPLTNTNERQNPQHLVDRRVFEVAYLIEKVRMHYDERATGTTFTFEQLVAQSQAFHQSERHPSQQQQQQQQLHGQQPQQFQQQAKKPVQPDNCDLRAPPIIHTLPTVTTGNIIIIGDIHGCADEFDKMLTAVQFRQGVDTLILAGDLVNKGKNSRGVVERAIKVGALSVLGNHDYSLLDTITGFAKAGKNAEPDPRDPMQRLARVFPAHCTAYLRSLPHIIKIPQYNITVVHAGINPIKGSLEDQNVWELMHMRRVLSDGSAHEVCGADGILWAKLWNGPQTIVFGHDARTGFQREPYAIGLDSGCVYGGNLTAVVYPGARIVTVPGWSEGINRRKAKTEPATPAAPATPAESMVRDLPGTSSSLLSAFGGFGQPGGMASLGSSSTGGGAGSVGGSPATTVQPSGVDFPSSLPTLVTPQMLLARASSFHTGGGGLVSEASLGAVRPPAAALSGRSPQSLALNVSPPRSPVPNSLVGAADEKGGAVLHEARVFALGVVVSTGSVAATLDLLDGAPFAEMFATDALPVPLPLCKAVVTLLCASLSSSSLPSSSSSAAASGTPPRDPREPAATSVSAPVGAAGAVQLRTLMWIQDVMLHRGEVQAQTKGLVTSALRQLEATNQVLHRSVFRAVSLVASWVA